MASNTLTAEIGSIRSLLLNPLPQSPTPQDIVDEMETTYQGATNQANNTGKAWNVNSFTLTTVAGTRTYTLDPTVVQDFYKALTVVTNPSSNADPQYTLEVTEIDNLPKEWGWLSQNQSPLVDSTHSAGLIAFYRTMTTSQESILAEIRPTPNSVQQYTVWYQQGNWWNAFIVDSSSFSNTLPQKEFRFYFRELAARSLVYKCEWAYGNNNEKRKMVAVELDRRLIISKQIYIDHLASMDNEESITLETWSDTVDPYMPEFRYR